MVALSDFLHHRTEPDREQAELPQRPAHPAVPVSLLAGGLIVLAAAIAGIVWFKPQLRRTARDSR